MTGLSNTREKSNITPEKSDIRISDCLNTSKLSVSRFHVTLEVSLYFAMSLSISSFSDEKDWGWGLTIILYPVDIKASINGSPYFERMLLSPQEGANKTVRSWAGSSPDSLSLFAISSMNGIPQRAMSLGGHPRRFSSCLTSFSWYSPDRIIAS